MREVRGIVATGAAGATVVATVCGFRPRACPAVGGCRDPARPRSGAAGPVLVTLSGGADAVVQQIVDGSRRPYAHRVALLLDRPAWPAHGRLWSHLVSDTSLEELHAFARRVGVPSRSFEGDHYDVPAERYDELVAAGARPVEGRELVRALAASGLRLPKRRGERVLASWPAVRWPGHSAPVRVDCLASPLPPPAATTIGSVLLAVQAGRLLLDPTIDALPTAKPPPVEPQLDVRRREESGWLR